MNKELNEEIKEDIISSFIDDLNNENKPKINNDIDNNEIYKENMDELEQLFEAIRAVKRLKVNKSKDNLIIKDGNTLDNNYEERIEKTQRSRRKNKHELSKKNSRWRIFRIVVTIAAAIILVFVNFDLMSSVLTNDIELGKDENKDDQKNPMNENILNNSNIVYAMEENYEKLESYIGIIEIKIKIDGKEIVDEVIKVKYKKSNKYLAIHNFQSGYTKKRISDGEKLYIVTPDKVTIDYSNPKSELWRYHIVDKIQELKKAAEIIKIGEEVFKGREVVVYEYKHSRGTVYHKVWIDKNTKMPLKTELNSPDGSVLINQFSEIEFNVEIDDDEFEFTPEENQEIVEINKITETKDIHEVWVKTDKLISQVPNEFDLIEIVNLRGDRLHDYLIKFKSKNQEEFIDFHIDTNLKYKTEYYYPNANHGILGDGWIEYQDGAVNVFKIYMGESNLAEGITPNWEMTVVSSLPSEDLIKILEKIEGGEMSPATDKELKGMGAEPLIPMLGH